MTCIVAHYGFCAADGQHGGELATSRAYLGRSPMAKNDWCGAQGIVGSMPWIAFGWLTLYMQMLVRCLVVAGGWLLCVPLNMRTGSQL